MPGKYIHNYAATAIAIAADDYGDIDGATNGTRRMLKTTEATLFGTQLATDGMIFGAGSAAAPKLAISTAGNGIYASAANTLDFTTNGVRSWQITSAGVLQRVGAGTLGTTTGDLTIQTGGGNGNFLLVPNGTGGTKIGNAIAPATIFHVSNTTTSNPRGVMSAQYTTDALSAQFHTRKGRGTEAAPTVIVTGDYLGRYVASGYDGTNYLEMGSIAFQATGTIAATRIPTQIVLSTATDATPSVRTDYVWIKPDGKVGVGTSAPATELHVSSVSTGTPRGIMSAQYTTDALGARYHMRKARGTETVPTIVVTGDDLGRLQWSGYDGAAYQEMASIRAAVTGTVAAGRVPTQLIFSVGTDAAPSVLTDRMVLGHGGFLGLGNGTPLAPLDFFGSNARTTIGGNGGPNITANGYFSSSWKYIESAKASVLFGLLPNGASSGDFGIYTAPSGTANSAITYTPRFMLMENGTCGFNTTNPGAFGIAVNQATGQVQDWIYNDSDGSPANHMSLVISSGGNATFAPSGGTFGITGAVTATGKVSNYNSVTTAGWGVPAIYAAGSVTGQVAANNSIATYTCGAADGGFWVSANVLVTTSGTEAFTVQCTYTDEGNTARTLTLPFIGLAGTLLSSIAFANGAVPYEGVKIHIRVKASTAITILTQAAGTYTSCVYNARGIIAQGA